MKIALTPAEKLRAAAKMVTVKLARRPVTVSIEVTKRCNARCDFCDYWKTKDRDELPEYTEVVRKFDPLVVVFTGGEPMLRRDLPALVRAIKELPGFRYLTVLTHGGLLTEPKVAELVSAGVNQIGISLNYPDARQDAERGIPGLFEKLERLVPRLAREGCNVFNLSSMLMLDNMGDAEPLVRLADRWGVNIAFSAYNDLKNGNQSHFVEGEKLDQLRQVCDRLKRLKRELKNVMTSDYFFDTLPEFCRRRELPGCKAGKIMIHISPNGMVHPCAELPPICHFSEFDPTKYGGVDCGKCFDSCRAEPQAPLTLQRVGELLGLT
jgi:MoaA/NifB/PqqE/SkfB family radical SAM enzyme